MKRFLYIIPLLVLLVSMIPVATVAAYEEGDVQVYYDAGGGVWVEIDQGVAVEFTDYYQLKLILNTGEAVDIWTMSSFAFGVSLELGETVFVGYGISGSGSSRYSGTVVSGMDAPDDFDQSGDPGGQFYNAGGPLVTTLEDTQYIEWEITDDGGLPSTVFYHMEVGGSHDVGDATGPIIFAWGVTGYDADCDDTYQQQDAIVASQEIQADDEDGEYAGVLTGNLYRLEVWGGPWNDGTDDRYDTAVSFDGSTWTPLTDYFIEAECFDVGDDPGTGTVFFLAPTDDFYIRVNDEAEAFGNNTGSMTYSLYLALQITELKCTDQFEWEGEEGDPYASYTIPADLSLGIEIKDLEVGAWYVYVTRDGPWLNNGSTERYDMAVKNTAGVWDAIADYEMVECIEDADDVQYTRYFFQAYSESLWTRVNDTDENWANDDSMGVDIYEATYDRFLDTCEGTYIVGDLVISKTFQGNQSGGVNVGTYDHYNNLPRSGGEGPVELLRYYVLDTLNGPWLDGALRKWTTQLRKESDGDWYETIIHPEMDCVTEIDLLGHVRAYFDMDKPYEYYIRVNETTTWTDNSGSMRYNLYEGMNGQVDDPEDPPVEGNCDGYYTRGSQIGKITFAATNGAGVNVPSITEYNEIYSIVTSGGPWDDGADPNRYEADISDDGGVTWYPLSEYPGMLCKQAIDTDYVEVFLQHVKGRRWKVRVNDTVFTDNSGNMSVTVYGAEADIDPWATCSDDYNLVEIPVPDPTWAAWVKGGTNVPYIEPSSNYMFAIEITGGPWLDDIENPEVESYDAQINDGSGWVLHNSYGICTEQVGDNNQYFRTYFDPEVSTYKLRVNVADDDWENNYGYLSYRLYRAYPVDPDDPTDPDDPGLPTDWDQSCYASCERPSGFFKWYKLVSPGLFEFEFPVPAAGQWVNYAFCTFTKWLSWCPEHTAALQGIPLMFTNRPPFVIYYAIVDLYDDIYDSISSFDWYPESSPPSILRYVTGGGDPSETDGYEIDLIPSFGDDSPWNGGSIEFGGDDYNLGGGENDYGFDCSPDMKEAASAVFELDEDGVLIKGYCFVSRMPMILKGYWLYLQITVDLGFIFLGFAYFQKKLQEMQS